MNFNKNKAQSALIGKLKWVLIRPHPLFPISFGQSRMVRKWLLGHKITDPQVQEDKHI